MLFSSRIWGGLVCIYIMKGVSVLELCELLFCVVYVGSCR